VNALSTKPLNLGRTDVEASEHSGRHLQARLQLLVDHEVGTEQHERLALRDISRTRDDERSKCQRSSRGQPSAAV
jgi:hypothetical protein